MEKTMNNPFEMSIYNEKKHGNIEMSKIWWDLDATKFSDPFELAGWVQLFVRSSTHSFMKTKVLGDKSVTTLRAYYVFLNHC